MRKVRNKTPLGLAIALPLRTLYIAIPWYMLAFLSNAMRNRLFLDIAEMDL